MTLADFMTKARQTLAAAGISDPQDDVRVLLEEGLGISWLAQLRDGERVLSAEEEKQASVLLDRRASRLPFSTIFGKAGFYGREFRLNEATLAPRPDSERMVELAVERALSFTHSIAAGQNTAAKLPSPPLLHLADLCTGSGALGLSLLAELQQRHIPADLLLSDIAPLALAAAQENARRLGLLANCRFVLADLFPDELSSPPAFFHLILCNPPYIERSALSGLDPEVQSEPRLALDGGEDGLDFYRRLAGDSYFCLQPGGTLLMEHGATQQAAIIAIFRESGWPAEALHGFRDYGAKPRVLLAKKT